MDLFASLITVINSKKKAHDNGRMSDAEYKAHVINMTKKINILAEHGKLSAEQAENLKNMM